MKTVAMVEEVREEEGRRGWWSPRCSCSCSSSSITSSFQVPLSWDMRVKVGAMEEEVREEEGEEEMEVTWMPRGTA